MLHRIRIQNYKSFKDVEVKLQKISILLGPNAVGKSNFIDAIFLLSKIVTSKNLQEAFREHRGDPLESFYYGDEGFDAMLKKDRVVCRFEIDIELSQETIDEVNKIIREKRKGLDSDENQRNYVTEKRLRYKVSIEGLPRSGILRIEDEELVAIRKHDGKPKARNPFIEKKNINGQSRLHLRMEGQAHPTYFQIGLDHTIVSTALYEPHYPHIIAFRKELEKWRTYYLEPRKLMRENVPISEINSIGPRSENLAAFLNTLQQKNPKSFENINLTIQKILPFKPKIDIEMYKEGRVGLTIVENGISFSARLISEGTLRIIGLISAIHPKNPSTLIAYEEPENGVHPVRLKHISELFKTAAKLYGKQIILTTHSPLFAELFDSDYIYVFEKTKAQTNIKPFHHGGPLFKRKKIEEALTEKILRGDFGG